MSFGYFVYNSAISLLAPFALGAVAARGRLKGFWRQRFGFVPEVEQLGRPRIWIHAVSVGEMQVAASIIAALRRLSPQAVIWQTATTDTGIDTAKKILPRECRVIPFPFDAYGGPGRALDRLKPDMVILLETELWPNFIKAAHARGVKIMLANGRISVRSVEGYRKVKFLFKEVLGYIDLMAMIRNDDKERIISLGADEKKVCVTGSAKFDMLLNRVDEARMKRLKEELGLDEDAPVIVAGSTRTGEEQIILNAFSKLRNDFPRLHLVIAPRHITRSDEIENLIRKTGLTLQRRSLMDGSKRPEECDVTLVDVMGELFFLYGMAAVAVCGGSFFDRGGQNPLEPAVWGRPVVYGRSMDDFLDARELLENAGAGFTADEHEDLYTLLKRLLTNKPEAERMGAAGKTAVNGHHGSAERQASLALELLDAR